MEAGRRSHSLPGRTLLTSYAPAVAPAVQRRREAALLEAGRLGEAHLHVSTLEGRVLGLGAFHLEPARAAGRTLAGLWRRHTGGRAIAAGEGFVVVTLGLPHRSALVSDGALALRPEQVMNRCVRGVLAWLRALGADASYPGLDLVTIDRRAVVHLSFTEALDGPTLFQAIVAVERSLADTARLLDEIDPEGRVPASLIPATSLREALGVRGDAAAAAEASLPTIARRIGDGFREAFGLEVEELDPGVTELLLAEEVAEGTSVAGTARRPPPDGADGATLPGLLGPVSLWVKVRGTARESGRIVDCGLSGDLIAPGFVVDAFEARLRGLEPRREAIRATLADLLDGTRAYVLGLKPAELEELVVRAAGSR